MILNVVRKTAGEDHEDNGGYEMRMGEDQILLFVSLETL